MKVLFWIVLVAFLVLAGYIVRDLVVHHAEPAQPSRIAVDVSAESAAVYERHAVALESRAELLRSRMAALGSVDRPEVKARLAEFNRQIRELRDAIEEWRVARGGDEPVAYRQCILLYGKASGVCDALAADTLAPGKK